ncbi:hypothetical protein PHYPO_G00093540 [Pangasianodon hypophthalmus]|uniref:Uncharacterized protein n=1 Tax=Pangasianodon hypophthalmus TaxID=310915 RepID=A0A5N5LCB6_PANHP|nr:hypothetical protein PHYPO_G00093540 [Pangasianodon hypophthalmus]
MADTFLCDRCVIPAVFFPARVRESVPRALRLHGTAHRAGDSCASLRSALALSAHARSRGGARSSPRLAESQTSSWKPGRAQRYHGLLHPADTSPAGPFHFRDQLRQSVRA